MSIGMHCTPTWCDWSTHSKPLTGGPFEILFDFGGGPALSLSDPTHMTVVDAGSRSGSNTYYLYKSA